MTNTQLAIALVAFCIIIMWSNVKHFIKAKARHIKRRRLLASTNYSLILQEISDSKTLEDLDKTEAKASKLLYDQDHSVINNSCLLIEHFNLKRFQLEGRLYEAEECADKIESMLRRQETKGIWQNT